MDSIKWLIEGMKSLPNSLFNLELDLYNNILGETTEDIKWLAEGMKNLPKNLHSLRWDLGYNAFVSNDIEELKKDC